MTVPPCSTKGTQSNEPLFADAAAMFGSHAAPHQASEQLRIRRFGHDEHVIARHERIIVQSGATDLRVADVVLIEDPAGPASIRRTAPGLVQRDPRLAQRHHRHVWLTIRGDDVDPELVCELHHPFQRYAADDRHSRRERASRQLHRRSRPRDLSALGKKPRRRRERRIRFVRQQEDRSGAAHPSARQRLIGFERRERCLEGCSTARTVTPINMPSDQAVTSVRAVDRRGRRGPARIRIRLGLEQILDPDRPKGCARGMTAVPAG